MCAIPLHYVLHFSSLQSLFYHPQCARSEKVLQQRKLKIIYYKHDYHTTKRNGSFQNRKGIPVHDCWIKCEVNNCAIETAALKVTLAPADVQINNLRNTSIRYVQQMQYTPLQRFFR